jgi:hypothetical protein
MKWKEKGKELAETLTVAVVMLVVLLPIRVLFVRYVADSWIGSFGLITAISLIIIILAKKGKLGWFGTAFHRQMYKVHRGKRKYFVYTNMVIGLLFFGGTIYAIEIGHEQFQYEIDLLKQELPSDNMQDIAKDAQNEFKIEQLPLAILVFFYVTIFRFDIFSVIMTTINDFSDGWILHFSTVFFVEQIEVIGLLVYYKFTLKSEEIK